MASSKERKIEKCLTQIVHKAARKGQDLTIRIARSRAEFELDLDEGYLASGEWKAKSKTIIQAAIDGADDPGSTETPVKLSKETTSDKTKTDPQRESAKPKENHRRPATAAAPAPQKEVKEMKFLNKEFPGEQGRESGAESDSEEDEEDEDEDDEGEDDEGESESDSEGEDEGEREGEDKSDSEATTTKPSSLVKPVGTVAVINGAKRKASSSEEDSDDDEDDEGSSSSSSDEDDSGEPQKKRAKLSKGQEESRKDERPPPKTNTPPIAPSTFKPPQGYTPLTPQPQTSTLLSPSSLTGKQIWHMTAPSSLPLSELTHFALTSINTSTPVLKSKDGTSYILAEDSPATSSVSSSDSALSLLIPSHDPTSNGTYKLALTQPTRTLHLRRNLALPPKLTARQADQATGSAAAADIARAPVVAARQQPKGLRMRYRPPGVRRGESLGGIDPGSGSESEEESTGGRGGPVQFPSTRGGWGTTIQGADAAGDQGRVAEGTLGDHPVRKERRKKKKKKKEKEEEEGEEPDRMGGAIPASSGLVNGDGVETRTVNGVSNKTESKEDKARRKEEKRKRKEEKRRKKEVEKTVGVA